MALYCGKREFQTWEEVMSFIEEFKQREKERQERAFYCWHNLPVKNIINITLKAGIQIGREIKKDMKPGMDEDLFEQKVIEHLTETAFSHLLQIVNMENSQELHTGPRLPIISFDTQEEKEEVIVN